ncbi:hypothetical protein KO481_40855 [Nocardia sp. NEAU-G5]|uniref:MFS transporter n=1 Tax=Nocardia albiluteola TaxID=2842303 RepID=A0ABS6BC34_9NOCA|nr:hypothetical protein [Nocardia albiluteola]MBU3067852.1 hypothetical protein [Nocardia albiluteola]
MAVAALALIAAGSFTTIAGLITDPLVEAKSWSRTAIGAGVGINMVLYGAVAPFSAAAMDRYGIRRVTAFALILLVASSALMTLLAPTVFFFVLWRASWTWYGRGMVLYRTISGSAHYSTITDRSSGRWARHTSEPPSLGSRFKVRRRPIPLSS